MKTRYEVTWSRRDPIHGVVYVGGGGCCWLDEAAARREAAWALRDPTNFDVYVIASTKADKPGSRWRYMGAQGAAGWLAGTSLWVRPANTYLLPIGCRDWDAFGRMLCQERDWERSAA